MATKRIKNPGGAPGKHGARALERLIRSNKLDARTRTAKLLRMVADDLADDAGGWPNLTNREKLLIERTAAAAVIMQSIEGYVFKQDGPVSDKGELLNVLRRGYLGYLAQFTRCLATLGLRPDRTAKTPDLSSYIEAATDEDDQDDGGSSGVSPDTRLENANGHDAAGHVSRDTRPENANGNCGNFHSSDDADQGANLRPENSANWRTSEGITDA